MHILFFHKGVHNFEIQHKRANFWLGVKYSLVIITEIAFLPHLALTSAVLVVVWCEVNSSPPLTRWMPVSGIHLDLWHSERRGPVEDLTEYLKDNKLRKAINCIILLPHTAQTPFWIFYISDFEGHKLARCEMNSPWKTDYDSMHWYESPIYGTESKASTPKNRKQNSLQVCLPNSEWLIGGVYVINWPIAYCSWSRSYFCYFATTKFSDD